MSVATAPFYTIAISMQLSVIPNLLIYGDVKPEQLKKPLIRRALNAFGIAQAKQIEANNNKLSTHVTD